MKRAPVYVTATMSLAVFLCLILNVFEARACSECLCFADNSCSEDECLPGLTTNCTRTEFTVDCDATYTFYTRVKCSSGDNCEKCMSCASLYSIDQGVETLITDDHNNGCNIGVCISSGTTVSLSTAKTYVMYACKVDCPTTGSSCASCAATCTAYACLYYGVVSCSP